VHEAKLTVGGEAAGVPAQAADAPGPARGQLNFPPFPIGWFHACSARRLAKGPLSGTFGGKRIVLFRTASNNLGAIDARCCHMGADLGNGKVAGEHLACPFHGWEFGTTGRCERIPAAADKPIPGFACQTAYPVTERNGHVFVFNRRRAPFPLPFFEGVDPDRLVAAKPFELTCDVPWHVMCANGFDLQHFSIAHDRALVASASITQVAPYARRMEGSFRITGTSLRDRIIAFANGRDERLRVTSWVGATVLAEAHFKRTRTYAHVTFNSLGPDRTLLRSVVFVEKGATGVLGAHLSAAIKRLFIVPFLREELPAVAGVRVNRATLIDADRPLLEFLEWLTAATDRLSKESA
jgi:phenylpropionate dioxygenase-like ring-hydroxylating dioxygenase large terminal subunit